jgi:LysR family cys regulon transcriptional activator
VDNDLCVIDVSCQFPSNITRIGLRRDGFLRQYGYDFIELFAPHLKRERIAEAVGLNNCAAADALFGALPHFSPGTGVHSYASFRKHCALAPLLTL